MAASVQGELSTASIDSSDPAFVLDAGEVRLFHATGLGASQDASALLLCIRSATLREGSSRACLLALPEGSSSAALHLVKVQR